MQDTYNLGWKLGAVVNGWMRRDVLATYQYERLKVAQDLIAMDERVSTVFASAPSEDELLALFEDVFPFMSGFRVHYGASMLTATTDSSVSSSEEYSSRPAPMETSTDITCAGTSHATKLAIGKHLHSFPVMTQANLCPDNLQRLIAADGRWRLLVFPGDISSDEAFTRLNKLGERLTGLLERYMSIRAPQKASHNALARPELFLRMAARMRKESLIDVLTIHCGPPFARDLPEFHRVFFPYNEVDGYDYDKIFIDADLKDFEHHYGFPTLGSGQAYEGYGIDREKGALVVCRPDAYVAFVAGLEDVDAVEQFFRGALIEQKHDHSTAGADCTIWGKTG